MIVMFSLFPMIFLVFNIVCLYFIFIKAGEHGWASVIPVYNLYILAKIAKCKWTFWVQLIGTLIAVPIIIISLSVMMYMDQSITAMPDQLVHDEYYEFSDDAIDVSEQKLTTDENAELNNVFEEVFNKLGWGAVSLIVTCFVLFIVPLPVFVANVFQYIGLVKVFNLHWLYVIGLIFLKPIFMGILAFNPNILHVGVLKD